MIVQTLFIIGVQLILLPLGLFMLFRTDGVYQMFQTYAAGDSTSQKVINSDMKGRDYHIVIRVFSVVLVFISVVTLFASVLRLIKLLAQAQVLNA